MIDYRRFLAARPTEDFIGRASELRRIESTFQERASSPTLGVAVVGLPGVGRSEFLRQAALGLARSPAEGFPLYFRCGDVIRSVPSGGASASAASLWAALIRQTLLQIAAWNRGVFPLDPPLVYLPTIDLARLSDPAGALAWMELLSNPHLLEPTAAPDCWAALASRGGERRGRPPIIVLEGWTDAGLPGFAAGVLADLLRAAVLRGLPFLIEGSPGDVETTLELAQAEPLDLSPLEAAAATELERHVASLAATRPGPSLNEIFPSGLATQPELAWAWGSALARQPGSAPHARRAWEAYLEVLTVSAWAARRRAALNRTLPVRGRLAFLLTVAALIKDAASGRPGGASIDAWAAALGVDPPRAYRLLVRLERHGFVARQADGFGPPALAPLKDWLEWEAGLGSGELGRGTGRWAWLRERLVPASPVPHAGPVGSVAGLLMRFRAQSLPESLFVFERYLESAGRVPPEHRRAELLKEPRTLRLPEILAVEAIPPRHPAEGGAAALPIYVAHGFSSGVYQRSHEAAWIVGDGTAVPTLTTAEVEAFLDTARRLEREFATGPSQRWMLAGEAISRDALNVMARERVLCSGPDQLALLEELTAPEVEEAPAASATEPAGLSPRRAKAGPRPTSIVSFGQPPGLTRTELRLAPRPDNELIAAGMAETIALRAGFDEEASARVKMAVLEGCLNAIEHTAHPEKEIRLAVEEHPDRLEITIDNEGAPFDPRLVDEPDPAAKLRARDRRGWGIKLMREFVDEVIYEPWAGGTRLRLVLTPGRRPRARKASPEAAGESP